MLDIKSKANENSLIPCHKIKILYIYIYKMSIMYFICLILAELNSSKNKIKYCFVTTDQDD